MQINPDKTELLLVGSERRVKGLNSSGKVDIAGTEVGFCDTVKILGVTLDSSLSFDKHVSNIVESCNYHIRALRHIIP